VFANRFYTLSAVRLASNNVLVHQPVEKVDLNHVDDEPFELTQEIEAQIIGNLLPDDDDLLSGVLDEVGRAGNANNGDDVEDDIFYTGGGMELETDENMKLEELNGGVNNGHGLLNGSLNGEHPYGEHPSRTLFVRNINGNVEDSELKALFEVCIFPIFARSCFFHIVHILSFLYAGFGFECNLHFHAALWRNPHPLHSL
jgi:hypothetical protein